MRRIGQLDGEEQARTFADYLFMHDIDAQLEPGPGDARLIWVMDEDRVEEAKALLSRFRSMPDAEEFFRSSEEAAARRRGEQREARATEQKLKRSGAYSWRMGAGGLTGVLLGVCIVAAMLTRLGESAEWTRWFTISNRLLLDPSAFWVSLAEVSRGEVWRLLTPVFLHFSIWHLLFNMLWLKDLGGILEGRVGTGRYAGILVLVALVSNLAQYVTGGPHFGGMSGVVYGIFGYLWVRNRMDFHFGVILAPMASGLLMAFLVLGLLGLLGPTANAAHFSGLVTGGALGWLAAKTSRA